jgi:hypothetical protein
MSTPQDRPVRNINVGESIDPKAQIEIYQVIESIDASKQAQLHRHRIETICIAAVVIAVIGCFAGIAKYPNNTVIVNGASDVIRTVVTALLGYLAGSATKHSGHRD